MADEQDPGFRALRFVVVMMGIVLLGGSIFLIAASIKKFNQSDDEEKRSCQTASMALQEGQSYEILELERRTATLHIKNRDGSGLIRRVHLCSGKVKAEFLIRKK